MALKETRKSGPVFIEGGGRGEKTGQRRTRWTQHVVKGPGHKRRKTVVIVAARGWNENVLWKGTNWALFLEDEAENASERNGEKDTAKKHPEDRKYLLKGRTGRYAEKQREGGGKINREGLTTPRTTIISKAESNARKERSSSTTSEKGGEWPKRAILGR